MDALCKKGLTTTFTGKDSWLYKDYYIDDWITLHKQGPLWFVPTLGRVKSPLPPKPLSTYEDIKKRLDEKLKTMSRYLAVIAKLPKPPATSWSDYWVVRKDCIIRVHRSARRKLYYPDYTAPVPLEELSGERFTERKSYPDNVITKVSDNWRTVNWRYGQIPTDRSWTGHTVFPLKNSPTKRLLGKTKLTERTTDFEFTREQLKPGGKDISQPPLQHKTVYEDKRRADEEYCYDEPRRAEEGTTTEDKMPENSQEARKAVGLRSPTMPSESERKQHELTHLPYRDWCQHCVSGKGKENHHRTLKYKTPTVQLDYSYLKQGPDDSLIKVKSTDVTKENVDTLITALTAIDTHTLD